MVSTIHCALNTMKMPTITVTKSPKLARPVKNMKPTMTTAITAMVFAKVPVSQVLIF